MALKKVGAFWKNTKDGKTYLSGSLSEPVAPGTKLLVFPNSYKKEDKHPDYTINVSADDQPAPQDNGSQVTANEDMPF